jgi:hypothetical protein
VGLYIFPAFVVGKRQICFSAQKFELNIFPTINIIRSDVAWRGIARDGDTVALEVAHTNFPRSLEFIAGTKPSESISRVTDNIREIDGTGTVISVTLSDLPQFVTMADVLICCIIGQLPSACDAGWTQKARLCVKVERAQKYGTFTIRTHGLKLVC